MPFLSVLFAGAAKADEPDKLTGAWVERGLECKDIFSSKGGRITFKRPLSPFKPALLIAGSTIQGPAATCQIVGRKPKGDRTILILSCATSVTLGRTEAVVKIGENSLDRYLTVNDEIGETYNRCAL